MAHFAQIENGIVTQVIVVNNKELEGGDEQEIGSKFCSDLFGGEWLQASYNGNIRNTFPSIGYEYNKAYDVFVEPKPFKSWSFSKETFRYEAPVPYPEDSDHYRWDEDQGNWI